MKKLSFLLGAVVLVAAAAVPPIRYTFKPTSKIWVEGTSTVHDFTCKVSSFTGAVEADGVAGLKKVDVSIPVKQLDCGNKTMDGKMYDALKQSAHPAISYTLVSAEATGGPQKHQLQTTGKLRMAGAERTVSMKVEGAVQPDGQIRFTGSLPVSLKEFDMKPPTAALGAIKVGDQVVVRFDVYAAPGAATAANQ